MTFLSECVYQTTLFFDTPIEYFMKGIEPRHSITMATFFRACFGGGVITEVVVPAGSSVHIRFTDPGKRANKPDPRDDEDVYMSFPRIIRHIEELIGHDAPAGVTRPGERRFLAWLRLHRVTASFTCTARHAESIPLSAKTGRVEGCRYIIRCTTSEALMVKDATWRVSTRECACDCRILRVHVPYLIKN